MNDCINSSRTILRRTGSEDMKSLIEGHTMALACLLSQIAMTRKKRPVDRWRDLVSALVEIIVLLNIPLWDLRRGPEVFPDEGAKAVVKARENEKLLSLAQRVDRLRDRNPEQALLQKEKRKPVSNGRKGNANVEMNASTFTLTNADTILVADEEKLANLHITTKHLQRSPL